MAQTLTSEMAQKSLGALLDRVERQREFSPDEARELLASCEIGSLVLERLWQLAQELLDRGIEGRKLTFMLKELADVVELGRRAFDGARARVATADLTPEEKSAGESMLKQVDLRTAEMRDELTALVRWLETPPAEVDPSSLPGGRADRDAQGYVNLEDLTSRLS
jgi:hypothetical protein